MNPESYLIGELAQKAGVTVRTIRYYISEGLLPSPDVRGRYSVYDEDYLKRIRLIQRLKEAFLPIKEIRKKLETETEEEIEEFLKLYESAPRPGSSALNYLANIDEEYQFMLKEKQIRPNHLPEPAAIRMVLDPEEELPWGEYPGTSWRRFFIVKGVELHVNDEVFRRHKTDIPAWIEELKKYTGRSIKN